MPTYAELMAQIEALQKQAEELRATEVARVIAEVKRHIRDYGLTAADLGFHNTSGPARQERGAQSPKRNVVKPKYQDPVSGQTWSGRGMMPKWLKVAIDSGRTRDEFLIPED